MIVESCHPLVPPEDVKPLLDKIIDNYVTEFCQNQHITVGINTIREILSRMPLALEPSQIDYLCMFRNHKNKSVCAATKSLINYFRDVCPELLPKRHVGRFTEIDESNALNQI
jgi:protein SDA1